MLAASRLEGLSSGSRQFTETASVLGRSFRLDYVPEVVDQSPGALLAARRSGVRAPAHGGTGRPGLHARVRPAGRGVPCLRHAAAQLTDPRVRSSATQDQGVLLARSGDEDEAARVFDEALRGYASMGAGRDVARMRRRLRKLGIRRRHWSTGKRPATGWESLTDTELATSRLVAQGTTNQRIAGQLFISTHTVAFHLRQVFRKLGITSRVELTRIAVEHARDGQTPDDSWERDREPRNCRDGLWPFTGRFVIPRSG